VNPPRIRVCKAAQGLTWVKSGLRLLGRQPMLTVVFVAIGPMFLWSLGLVPLVGTAFALILWPTAMLGMLATCRTIDAGSMPTIAAYVEPWRDARTRLALVKLGIFYAIVMGILGTFWATASWDMVPHAAAVGAPAEPALPASGEASQDFGTLAPTGHNAIQVLISLVFWVPLQMSIWFAPVLVGWYAMSAGKSAFFSFFACWRNKGAMLVYLVGMFVCVFVAVMGFAAVIGLLGISDQTALYVFAPLVLLSVAASQTSTLAMVRAVVDDDESGPDAPLPPATMPPQP
jgi:hypothetical protein